ncbi:MAG: ABC transporter [Planctomycetota bacterium]|nr:ABC transporter [Planctomycetota bacterium]
MATYSISKSFTWQGTITDKVASVCRMFGLTTDRLTERRLAHDCRLEINTGDIVYLTGPSGAGKSVLLGELEQSIPASDRVNLAKIELPGDRTVIDCIDGDFLEGLRLLSTAGLNDCFCILNQPSNLSAGEKYRFRLAMALAQQKQFVFADEFCCELDRITAAVISSRLRAFAKRTGTTFILASSHDDIVIDLEPDVLIVKEFSGQVKVVYKDARRRR